MKEYTREYLEARLGKLMGYDPNPEWFNLECFLEVSNTYRGEIENFIQTVELLKETCGLVPCNFYLTEYGLSPSSPNMGYFRFCYGEEGVGEEWFFYLDGLGSNDLRYRVNHRSSKEARLALDFINAVSCRRFVSAF